MSEQLNTMFHIYITLGGMALGFYTDKVSASLCYLFTFEAIFYLVRILIGA